MELIDRQIERVEVAAEILLRARRRLPRVMMRADSHVPRFAQRAQHVRRSRILRDRMRNHVCWPHAMMPEERVQLRQRVEVVERRIARATARPTDCRSQCRCRPAGCVGSPSPVLIRITQHDVPAIGLVCRNLGVYGQRVHLDHELQRRFHRGIAFTLERPSERRRAGRSSGSCRNSAARASRSTQRSSVKQPVAIVRFDQEVDDEW